MFKKILSLALALMMILSVAAVAASAAENDVAEQGAEGEVAATGLDPAQCLNFDVSTSGWADFGAVGFYVFPTDGSGELIPWGSKKLFKSEETSTGIWSYDPAANGMELVPGTEYAIIFVNQNSGGQTYNLLFDTSCLGDTAYCTGNEIENPTDSNKTATEAKWRNSSYGPQKVITSIGNVVGETIAASTNAYNLFVDFLKNTLGNARTFSGKDDQTLIDDTAKALDLTKADVEKAISEAGATTEWKKDKSSLADGGSDTTTDSKTSTDSKTTTTSTTGGSTTTSSKSGAASNTQTGQGETVLFIMLGVMVAAAGVIFFARKRERA